MTRNAKTGLTMAALGAALLLSACAGNQYQEPNGRPATWGEQHYVDNQTYQQWTTDRLPR